MRAPHHLAPDKCSTIGILDFPGLHGTSENQRFDSLVANYMDEKIYKLSVQQVFEAERKEYKSEILGERKNVPG